VAGETVKVRVCLSVGVCLALAGGGALARAQSEPPRELRASLALLPGLVDSAEQGAFVELVKAMDAVYPGRIQIRVYPMARSIQTVIDGEADFHVPILRDPEVPAEQLPYAVADESFGVLANVIYSHVSRKLSRDDIERALARGGEFPYRIEATGGGGLAVRYPHKPNNKIDLALKKLNAGRLDAFIHPQEEADALIEAHRLKHIHRALYSTNYDMIVIAKGEAGSAVNALVSACVRQLRDSGELERMYGRVHRPYSDWQPAAMGW
jgi:polar amino acid transport system substrate-binding protein